MKERKSSLELKDFGDLMDKDLPLPIWVMDGVIPEGTTVLVGDPKSRKSYFAMQLVAAAMVGLPFCEGGPVVTKATPVYFALDDPEKRLQARYHNFSDAYRSKFKGMMYSTDWFENKDNHIQELEYLFEDYPEHDLYIIDVLAKVKVANSSGKNLYEDDYAALAAFKELFCKHGKSLMIIHHTNKSTNENGDWSNSISGTKGIQGAVDTMMKLDVDYKKKTTTLRVRGNDIEELGIPMEFNGDTETWSLSEQPRMELTEKHRKVAAQLSELPQFRAADIIKSLKVKKDLAKKYIQRLKKYPGLLDRHDIGLYSINPDNPYGITKSPIVSLHDPSVASIVNDIDLAHLDKVTDYVHKSKPSEPKLNGKRYGSFARSNEKYMLKYVRTPDDNINISN